MLHLDDVHVAYGEIPALKGVGLDVRQGEIVSLLGRNGVGRSTTIKSIMGQVDSTGSVRFKGEQINGLKTYMIARRGLGYVPENREIFPSLTVRQNLMLGMKNARRSGRWSVDDMFKLFPVLRERTDALAGVVSGGEQQMLTLCRTLMGDPDLVIVDEPTEGLAPKIVERVAHYLKALKQHGVSILLIEQKLTIAMDISDRCLVMGHGSVVFTGTPTALRQDSDIRKEWLEV
jgi:branched-chain amino acid transport system ATP-binding protein